MLNSTEEIWIDVKDYEGIYKVSSLGRIRNEAGRVLKPWKINSGYRVISLSKEGKGKKVLVHRLVALCFLTNPDPEVKTCVNHIDFDRENNRVTNLEWVSTRENLKHSRDNGRLPYNVPGLGKKRKDRKSRFHNVSFDKSRNKWIAYISVNWKKLGFKRFDTELEAAAHVNAIINEYSLTDRPKNIL